MLSRHESLSEDDVRVEDVVSHRDHIWIVCSYQEWFPQVMVISTDYRDYRKAAFQEYAIAWVYNTVKIPEHIPSSQAAAAGVAFVAAALAMGISLGIKFLDHRGGGPIDLLSLARAQNRDLVPEDVRKEIFENSSSSRQPQQGDWILVMAGKSTFPPM